MYLAERSVAEPTSHGESNSFKCVASTYVQMAIRSQLMVAVLRVGPPIYRCVISRWGRHEKNCTVASVYACMKPKGGTHAPRRMAS